MLALCLQIQKQNFLNGIWGFMASELAVFFGLIWSSVHLGMSPSVAVQMQVDKDLVAFVSLCSHLCLCHKVKQSHAAESDPCTQRHLGLNNIPESQRHCLFMCTREVHVFGGQQGK